MDQLYKNKLGWGVQVSRGNILDASVQKRIGVAVVGTEFSPIADALAFRTPQAGAATPLRIAAGGSASDTSNGSGARSVRLTGLNANGDVVIETLSTAGALASVQTAASFIRLFDAEVIASGTYGTQIAGSHAGNIVIENAAGTETWATIPINGFPTSRTSICSYTIPRNHTGFVEGISILVEDAKLCSVLMLSRSGVLDAAAPYKPVAREAEWIGVVNNFVDTFTMPIVFPALTDVGMLAKVSNGTGSVTVQMDILLLRNE